MRNRSLGRSGVLALLAGVLWCCLAVAAMAHASLTAADPPDGAVSETAPKTLSLSFSEPVSPLVLKLVLPDGRAIPLEEFVLRDRTLDITPPGGLGDGTYVLTWRVVSEDGHPVAGSTVFSIGAPGASPPVAGEAVDWPVRTAIWLSKVALYAGLFFGIGGVFAMHWLIPGGDGGRRAISAALVTGLLATTVSAGLQGLDALGLPLARLLDPPVWAAGLKTSFGATVVVLAGAFLLAMAAVRPNARPTGRAAAAAALVTGSLALALSGHASAAAPQWLTRPAVFLHALTIAIWIGALLPLAFALRSEAESGREALGRFSRIIPLGVAVLVAAGTVLAVVQVREPSALFSTDYGNVLLAKLALLLVLFGLVAVNRWLLTRPAENGEAGAAKRLVRAIAVETLIVLAVFAVAAVWRFTPPPRALATVAVQPASMHIHSDKAMAEVTISPGRAGPVEVSAVILSPDFAPLAPQEVVFVFSNPKAGIEPMRRKAARHDDGTWRAGGLVLPLAGQWTLRIDVLISDFELVRLQDTVEVRP
ncbi:copper resistance CopC/CopD family protein [Shinella sp. BYT-45]|uniref:copper resistance CopC/CopD family protein n=1 Tax=Shinella sp. BYT-45 TaxID=3377377 RepID=UPI0039804E72